MISAPTSDMAIPMIGDEFPAWDREAYPIPGFLRRLHERHSFWMPAAQLVGTLLALTLVPGSLAKAIILPVWWFFTFGAVTVFEAAVFLATCGIFTVMNAQALSQGVFAFASPDLLGMPWFELMMWGFYLLHTRRALRSIPGPAPVPRWLPIFCTAAFAVVFSSATGDASRFWGPASVIAVTLLVFHSRSDLAHMAYMVGLGALIEYAGVWTGQWSYPTHPLGGVPAWFISMWAGVGLYAIRLFPARPAASADAGLAGPRLRTRRPISINNSLAHGICNYSCTLCSVNKPSYSGPRQFQPLEVTTALIERVKDAARSGIHVRYLANAGDGEPTLHPDFIGRMGLFGRMLKEWDSPVPAPEVSVVTNGSRLTQPGILDAVAGNGLTLIVSFPTPDPTSYGEIMAGEPARGAALLSKVVPGIERAMALAAAGKITSLYFHISPPDREVVRRDFARTLDFLATRAQAAGLGEIKLVLFPSTSNRSGLVRNWVGSTDMYRDFFRKYNGRTIHGVTIRMKLVLDRFFHGVGEIADLVRAFHFPCLWNASLFIAADGSSICCNDQAVRNPMGHVLAHSIDDLMVAKEDYRPGRTCAGCDQRPEKMRGSWAACTFALASRCRQAAAPSCTRNIRKAPVGAETAHRFGANGRYTVRVASRLEDRQEAWALVHRIYRKNGYALEDSRPLWYGIHDALPETTTLLVECESQPVAALTLVFDSPLGLPADPLYRQELDAMRARGRRPCEIISLASDESNLRHGAEIMKHLFKLGYLVARRLQNATDFLITVNPRHVRFYERTLLMQKRGPERAYSKVGGAPAVLLGLDLDSAGILYRDHYGEEPGSFYRFFSDPATEPALLRTLARARQPLTEHDLTRFFVDERPLIPELPGYLRHYINECYPDYRLAAAGSGPAAGPLQGAIRSARAGSSESCADMRSPAQARQ